MNILLCDDDITFLKAFEKFFTGFSCHIYKYTSIESAKNSDVIFDIAFLDIVFDEGALVFDLIKSIRKKNPKCVIAFVTNHIKYAPEGYEYKAFRYILKNEPEALIKRRINDVVCEYDRLNMTICGSYKNERFVLSPKDICYIEISNHLLKLYTSDDVYEMYNRTGSLYENLSRCGFVRCHRSFLVNLNYVRTIRDDSFFILTAPRDAKIPLGIRYKAEAKRNLLNYIGENL